MCVEQSPIFLEAIRTLLVHVPFDLMTLKPYHTGITVLRHRVLHECRGEEPGSIPAGVLGGTYLQVEKGTKQDEEVHSHGACKHSTIDLRARSQ